jgi:cytochrome c-type biogenesis protein CcsB
MGEFSTLDHAADIAGAATPWMVALDKDLTMAVFILAGVAALVFLAEIVLKRAFFRQVGYWLMAGAGLATLGELGVRYAYMVKVDPHYWPLSNLFESVMYMVFLTFAIYLVVERMFKPIGFGMVAGALITTIMGLASLLPPRLKDAHPLVPSLQSYWLKIHVSLMLTSYAAFFISFVAAIIYLFLHYRQQWLAPKSVGAMAAEPANRPGIGTMEMLDELTYRMILFGFPILAFGIITGGLWANHAWGTYWSWDPKETWALITWLVYASYLHVRMSRGWEGHRAAWFAVAGFVSVLITYLGVNYLATGLHTYGKLL